METVLCLGEAVVFLKAGKGQWREQVHLPGNHLAQSPKKQKKFFAVLGDIFNK